MAATVDEALEACQSLPVVRKRLQVLHDLGLGYLTLGEETPGLSGGEAQRLKLASEMGRPQEGSVFVFDEPTIGLDIVSQQKIRDFLHYYNEQTKTTVILTSHYMRDIEALCSRAVIINSGTLVYDGALSDINHRMGDKRLLTLSFSSPVETGKLSIFGRVRENKDLTAVLEIPKERIKETASQMLSMFPVDDFTVTEVPLEESIARIFTGEVAG